MGWNSMPAKKHLRQAGFGAFLFIFVSINGYEPALPISLQEIIFLLHSKARFSVAVFRINHPVSTASEWHYLVQLGWSLQIPHRQHIVPSFLERHPDPSCANHVEFFCNSFFLLYQLEALIQ